MSTRVRPCPVGTIGLLEGRFAARAAKMRSKNFLLDARLADAMLGIALRGMAWRVALEMRDGVVS
jgi:hypothetical protein